MKSTRKRLASSASKVSLKRDREDLKGNRRKSTIINSGCTCEIVYIGLQFSETRKT
jgi:hypothetical protein